jgi:hypothetical protein
VADPLDISRRRFLAAGSLALGGTAAPPGRGAEAPPARERLPGHRNLFNGDCTFLFTDSFVKDPTAKYDKATLHWFIDVLADSGVDTYLVNPNAQVPWYPSQRTPNILTGYRRGDREFFRRHFRPGLPEERLAQAIAEQVRMLDRYLDLAEAGVNWIEEIARACRRRKLSPWLSVRMNDMHGANSWEGSYMNCALQKDPRFRLSGKQPNPKDPVNPMEQSLNYAKKEVRDYMLLMIRELVEDHDFEGLELDWLRCPFCIDPPASPDSIALMTRWTAEVRRLTQVKARQTGKPYPLGLRVPCRLGLVKAVGLDVQALAREGLIDFVGLSNFWQTSWDVPYDELRRELGDRVALYGVIEDAPNRLFARDPEGKKQWLPARLLSASSPLLLGNTAGKLALGVDGIETFNFFCTDEGPHTTDPHKRRARYPALRDLDRLDKLRGQPKQYALASMHGLYQFPLFELAEQVPVVLEPEWKKAFRLSMCAEPPDAGLVLVVQVVVETTTPAPEVGVSFNGSWPSFRGEETNRLLFPAGVYTHHVAEHQAFNFRFEAAQIKEGWNEVLVFNGSHKRATPEDRRTHAFTVVGVELGVQRPATPRRD